MFYNGKAIFKNVLCLVCQQSSRCNNFQSSWNELKYENLNIQRTGHVFSIKQQVHVQVHVQKLSFFQF